MQYPILLFFGLLSAVSGLPGPLGITESLPDDQVEDYFDAVALSVKTTFNKPTPIPDLDWGIDKLFGVPFVFRIQTRGGQFEPPGDVKRVGDATGLQEMSETAHVKGFLYLGDMTVSYGEMSVNIFSLKVSGRAKAVLHDATVPVKIQLYTNALNAKKKAAASIGEFQGLLTIHLGSGTVLEKILGVFFDALVFLRNIRDVFTWAFFANIVSPIEKAITAAALGVAL